MQFLGPALKGMKANGVIADLLNHLSGLNT